MGPVIRIIAATLLICCAWLAVVAQSKRRRSGARRHLELVARLGLSKGVTLAVVRVAGRGLVLGYSERGVSLVAELADEELQQIMAAKAAESADAEPRPALPVAASPAAAAAAAPAIPIDLRSITHTQQGPRMGPVQRLRRMTLRTHVPAGTGRLPRTVRGPIRHEAGT